MSARAEKRWLKSVVDPDLVSFFEDSQFDAAEYAKGFYEQREASQAPRRVEKLEGLKRQTESALREEVVRNYKAFMHATEEIRTMEADIQTLKDLLGSTAVTLQCFEGVHLVETVKPGDKNASARSNSRAVPSMSGRAGDDDDNDPRDVDGVAASRGLKLPEWLDQAPIELEELLLERKHQEAASLIRRVREFSANVQNATNLGRGVERIFQKVETMAGGMADRLLAEISAANTLTVWGFREHKSNFALLITLGHGEQAATFFVGERSAMIRRSLRLVEVTADPLSYVGVLSETFFGQVLDAVTAFIKLFCKSAKIHERRSIKSGKSTAYYQIYQGVKDCGTAPFCRLVVWVNQQIDQYAVLMGRQVRAVTMGPQRVTREQSGKKGVPSGEEAGFRLGPVASSLFSIVSLMLEEGFAAAAVLNTMGFPVGVQLASRLVPDVTHFLNAYVDSVKDNMVEAIRKDPFVTAECKLLRPEALFCSTQEEEADKAKKAYLTSSARILVLEARDILDYALVLLEPPPPDMHEFGPSAAPPPPGADGQEVQASYYTRDEFLELEPVIVTSLDKLLRTFLKETSACMRARRDELSSHQSAAVVSNLTEMGANYVPLLAAWCAQLLPEIAEEEEVIQLRSLRSEFQRSAQHPFRARDSAPSSSSFPGLPSTKSSGSTAAATAAATAKAASARGGGVEGGGGGREEGGAAGGGGGGRRGASEGLGGRGTRGGLSKTAAASEGAGTSVSVPPTLGSRHPSNSSATAGATGTWTSISTVANKGTREKIPSLRSSLEQRPPFFSSRTSPPRAATTTTATNNNATATESNPTNNTSIINSANNNTKSNTTAAPFQRYRRLSEVKAAALAVSAASAATTSSSTSSLSLPSPFGSISRKGSGSSLSKSTVAEAASKAAASASVGGGGGGGGGAGAGGGSEQRRPTLTLKAAREAAKSKAKAAANTKAAPG